jgi:hypothetical protein
MKKDAEFVQDAGNGSPSLMPNNPSMFVICPKQREQPIKIKKIASEVFMPISECLFDFDFPAALL